MSQNLIPERLKKAREQQGITMAEASRRLKLSKIGYCRYEYGERAPSPQIIEVIAQCFHTSVDYLIGYSDDPNPNQIKISQEDEPKLFEIVEFWQQGDVKRNKKLYDYYKKIIGE
ncbi:MAG: helix-turn-helix domain-containing protein [Saccharofermentans sp.]|nr:helix-turn-helix domain-containing protein [Saccharofermentans sp.]